MADEKSVPAKSRCPSHPATLNDFLALRRAHRKPFLLIILVLIVLIIFIFIFFFFLFLLLLLLFFFFFFFLLSSFFFLLSSFFFLLSSFFFLLSSFFFLLSFFSSSNCVYAHIRNHYINTICNTLFRQHQGVQQTLGR